MGAVIGGIIGGIVLITVIVATIFWCVCRRKPTQGRVLNPSQGNQSKSKLYTLKLLRKSAIGLCLVSIEEKGNNCALIQNLPYTFTCFVCVSNHRTFDIHGRKVNHNLI